MNLKKILIIIGILIIIILIVNESRFIIWGPFGIPEQLNRPNCGEDRYKFNILKINSETDFLYLINDFKNITSEQKGFFIAQWVKGPSEYNLSDVRTRNSGSLFFRQKMYSITIKNPECSNLILEISEKGYASLRGCCGK